MWEDCIVRGVPRIGVPIRFPRRGLGVLRLGVTRPGSGVLKLGVSITPFEHYITYQLGRVQ